MMKLNLAPDQQGYGVNDNVRQVYEKLDGGRGRMRRDFLNQTVRVTVQWTVTEDDYQYLMTFYRVTKEGTEPFTMDLLIWETGLVEHECVFVPQSFKLTDVRGSRYTVRAQLDVTPNVPDDAFDEGLVTVYEAFAAESSESLGELTKLVNVSMPASFK